MSKEKQIYNIEGVILASTYDDELIKEVAQNLYNAGYRKQSEGEWIETRTGFHCSVCCKKPGVISNRGVFLSKFCPNCGAKMKGGAE